MKALICENLQNNYFKGGIEECIDAERCIPIINELLTKFDLIIGPSGYKFPLLHG